jgi:hypothetical protein
MTTEKVSFSERRQALEVAGTRLRNAIADMQAVCDAVDAESNAMRAAEARFAERDKSRKAAKTTRHG